MTRSLRVALVGPDLQENLALEYLAGAVERAGHDCWILPYCHSTDIDPVCQAVLRIDPHVLGLGIAFQYAVEEYLALVRALRERGYRGHVTCGGHVPTFCYEELLRDAPGLDSVVRHEGEQTLVELVEAIGEQRGLADITGLVWRRAGEVIVGPKRALQADLDSLAWPKRSGRTLLLGGVRLAFLLTSRGCVGDCAYCCIRAFGRVGGTGLRLRSVQAVAEEVASLYSQQRVRMFFVQDDLFLLPQEKAAVERLEALDQALRAQGVRDARFWIKGRPDSLTPAVLNAAKQLGVLHIFLGVESASPRQLRYLGRTHTPQDNRRALEACGAAGILPSFNLMLFDPDCTLEDVRLSLDFAEGFLAIPWNLCRTEVYSGTRLLERLQAEQRLEGDYRTYGYRMKDDRAEVMFRVLRVCFQDRVFSYDSLLNRLITLAFAGQVRRAFFPGEATQQLLGEIDGLAAEVQRDTVQRLRTVLDYVSTGDLRNREAVQRWTAEQAKEANLSALPWHTRYEALWERTRQP